MKAMIVACMALASALSFAEPTVTDVVAKQRYPWNGLVDITCTVSGISGTTAEHKFSVAAVMPDSGEARKVSQFWVVRGGINSTDQQVHTNGNYHLLWDASADLGQVAYDNMVMRVTVKTRNMVQLWEGGPYWADTNIGAENPEDYGYYFWWGDTEGYKRENNQWLSTGRSSIFYPFVSSYTPTCSMSIAKLKSAGWIMADSVLVPAHDAAHVHWGDEWRMPTDAEFSALISNCTTTWITTNGVSGRLVTGKGAYANRSIFLPAAGYGDGSGLKYPESDGYYWSSTPDSNTLDYAQNVTFDSNYFFRGDDYRYLGQPVRPVRGFAQ